MTEARPTSGLRLRLTGVPAPRFVLLIAGAGAVVLVAALAIWSVFALERTTAEADDATQVRGRARQLVIDLFSVESAQRGYLLTSDAAYRRSYDEARAQVATSLAALEAIAPAALAPQVADLTAAVQAKLAEMAVTVQLVDADQRAAAIAAVQTRAGTRAMDNSIAALEAIIAIQSAARLRRVAERHDQVRTTVLVVVGGSTIAVLALFVGIASLRKRTIERSRAIDELRRQAVELDERRQALGTAAAKLALANQALARSNRDLDQFAYVASHDLKAPLRGISSLATWIEEDLGTPLEPTIAEHLRLLRSRVERLELLIEGILSYSRAGRTEAATEVVDARAVATRTIELAAPPPEVTVELAPGPWPRLTTVPMQLEQVWLNLVANAIKHGRRADGGGRVVLGCAGRDGELWHFTVTDDGPGIPAEYHQRVFEMFQRLQPRDKVEGAGIGLAVVRKLVTGGGGRVWAESSAAGGTTMHFTWRGEP